MWDIRRLNLIMAEKQDMTLCAANHEDVSSSTFFVMDWQTMAFGSQPEGAEVTPPDNRIWLDQPQYSGATPDFNRAHQVVPYSGSDWLTLLPHSSYLDKPRP